MKGRNILTKYINLVTLCDIRMAGQHTPQVTFVTEI